MKAGTLPKPKPPVGELSPNTSKSTKEKGRRP
nr:MAG TPA: hypothetical protein [Caudoviricetes sp.]